MKYSDDFDDRKKRQPKIKKERLKKHLMDDDTIKKHNAKKEIKKIKESFDDEEWEQWDQHYNH